MQSYVAIFKPPNFSENIYCCVALYNLIYKSYKRHTIQN